MFRLLFVFCFALVKPSVLSAHRRDRQYNQWDGLAVTYLSFSKMPLTVDEAKIKGWVRDAKCGDCVGFVGNRYIKDDDDKSTRLIFNEDGMIAGIQATITPNATFPLRKSEPWVFVKKGAEALLTAYFRHPKTICKKTGGKRKVGSQLYIQTKPFYGGSFKDKAMKIPKTVYDLDTSKWIEGKCFSKMGNHYWYNISPKKPCDDLFPVFLMFDKTSERLKAFGWAVNTYVSGHRWLHPKEDDFKNFFDLKTVPTCLKYQQVSTQHIYLTDPDKLECPKEI